VDGWHFLSYFLEYYFPVGWGEGTYPLALSVKKPVFTGFLNLVENLIFFFLQPEKTEGAVPSGYRPEAANIFQNARPGGLHLRMQGFLANCSQ
jgi:hypothetical protein